MTKLVKFDRIKNIKLPEGSFLIPETKKTMTKITRHTILVLAIVGLVISNIGAMRGAADYHYIVEEDSMSIEDASIVIDNSLAKRANIRTNVFITAYSSTEDQTDSTPFITASGTKVRDGVVAANWLPIGTKVKIPALFGNKIFIVEDRMAPKNAAKLDIWFSTTEAAINFGVKRTRVEIL